MGKKNHECGLKKLWCDKIGPVTLLRFRAKNEVVEDHVTERSLFKMDNFLRRDINGFLVLADCQFQYN